MKQAVEHYSDGRSAWKRGLTGFFVTNRGFVIPISLTLFSMGEPWWWPANSPTSMNFSVKWVVFFFILFVSGFSLLALIYLRYRIRRSLNTKYYLHMLTHDIRNKQTELYKKLVSKKNFSNSKLNKELEMLLTQICENVAMHFRLLTSDHSICAAIRLAVYKKDINKTVVYKTYARSKGLNAQRQKTSEPIPVNQGIPRFLRDEKSAQGVLIYNDLRLAADSGAYHLTANDKKYPDEIKSMMVAPLNAWSGSKQDMIGILYITSSEDNKFSSKYVDSVAFIADLTAAAVANSIELVRLKCDNLKNRRN